MQFTCALVVDDDRHSAGASAVRRKKPLLAAITDRAQIRGPMLIVQAASICPAQTAGTGSAPFLPP